jgi:hypothetical protein
MCLNSSIWLVEQGLLRFVSGPLDLKNSSVQSQLKFYFLLAHDDSGIWRHADPYKKTDVSEEPAASIFREQDVQQDNIFLPDWGITEDIQRGPKKCTHSLSAAITLDTLIAVFAHQFGGIDAV